MRDPSFPHYPFDLGQTRGNRNCRPRFLECRDNGACGLLTYLGAMPRNPILKQYEWAEEVVVYEPTSPGQAGTPERGPGSVHARRSGNGFNFSG